jgi:hypothetical protein
MPAAFIRFMIFIIGAEFRRVKLVPTWNVFLPWPDMPQATTSVTSSLACPSRFCDNLPA